MEMTFHQRLTQIFHRFDLTEAYALLQEVREFEKNGGQLDSIEKDGLRYLERKIQQTAQAYMKAADDRFINKIADHIGGGTRRS